MRPSPTPSHGRRVSVSTAARALTAVAVALTLASCYPGAVAGSGEDAGALAAPPEASSPPREPITFALGAPLVENPADAPLPFSSTADPAWIDSTAGATLIPPRVLQAYAAAAVISGRENPGCRASWNLLAGIGSVESFHGLLHGGSVDDAGVTTPAIYGVPLDGSGVADIPDSDGGAIDGDASVDRAAGPMQFIPDTWQRWRVDANGDGTTDPQNIDDAALAAVHYLCRAGGDLGTPEGWRAAVLAWNRSEEYLADVSEWADRYHLLAEGA